MITKAQRKIINNVCTRFSENYPYFSRGDFVSACYKGILRNQDNEAMKSFSYFKTTCINACKDETRTITGRDPIFSSYSVDAILANNLRTSDSEGYSDLLLEYKHDELLNLADDDESIQFVYFKQFLERFLEEITPTEKSIVEYIMQGYSCKEIADAKNICASSIRSTLSRARIEWKKMKCYQEYIGNEN